MKDGQTSIFYMAADTRAAAESAPFVEQLVKRDYEVRNIAGTSDINRVTSNLTADRQREMQT